MCDKTNRLWLMWHCRSLKLEYINLIRESNSTKQKHQQISVILIERKWSLTMGYISRYVWFCDMYECNTPTTAFFFTRLENNATEIALSSYFLHNCQLISTTKLCLNLTPVVPLWHMRIQWYNHDKNMFSSPVCELRAKMHDWLT